MRKTIQGKRYDTNSATIVGQNTNLLPTSDFHYFYESLYRSPRGAWFLAGEGGALSRYASRAGGRGSWGERIIPLTRAEALLWLEQTGGEAAIEAYFGDEVRDA